MKKLLAIFCTPVLIIGLHLTWPCHEEIVSCILYTISYMYYSAAPYMSPVMKKLLAVFCTVPCRGNIPRPAGRGSRVAGDPRVESKTDMHILINQPAGARVRTSSVYNVVTICFTGFGYPKHIKTFTN